MAPLSLKHDTKRTQIKDRIRHWIREQGLQPGDRILSQNRLAEIFRVTPVTVYHALTELAAEGVIYRVKGRGTFVGERDLDTALRSVCLVLPGEGLDRPDRNPGSWLYVQSLMRAFLENAGDTWSFAALPVDPEAAPEESALSAERHDVVFFHYNQQPRALLCCLAERKRTAVVSLSLPPDDLDCLTVDHDRVAGSRLGVQHLIAQGHRRIGFVGDARFWGELSFEGYTQALKDAKFDLERDRVVRYTHGRGDMARAAAVLKEQRCDAVFVDSDLSGLELLDTLREEGLSVPAHIGLLSYDGLDWTVEQPPYLTAVRIPFRRMIGAALREIAQQDFGPTPRRHMNFLGAVAPGRTCARVRVQPPSAAS